MKRILQLALALIAAASLAHAQMPAKAAGGNDEQTIRQMEQDWGVALAKNDVAFMDRIEAPEYMFTGPDGSISDKAQGLAEFKTGVAAFTSFTLDDLKVKVIGDTAVVFGLDTEKSSYKGADTSGQYRFTDVFVRRNGVWQAVATHASKVEKH